MKPLLRLCALFTTACQVAGFFSSPTTITPRRMGEAPFTTTQTFGRHPKLIVFDLDHTLWTPELYQLRKLQRANTPPVAGEDVKLMEGTHAMLKDYVPELKAQGVQFAVASRTKSVEWAHALLGQFGLKDILDHIEIFPGNKRMHFSNLHQTSGINYEDMLFFDDARDGKFGNCEPVSEMGVLSVHCPNGLDTIDVFTTGLKRYEEWDQSPNKIVEWDGTVTDTQSAFATKRRTGVIKMVNSEKRYGFIRYREGSWKDLFFHFRHVEENNPLVEGDEVSFVVQRDPKNGKLMAGKVTMQVPIDTNNIQMRCFSMNMPFAGLLANGYKTLESRNGTMFTPYPEGTQMLLHVGRRNYPDGDKHIDVMKSGGLTDEEISELKTCPQGYGRGNVIAIMELGKTYETTLAQRSDPEFQRKVAAFGADSGRFVTEIKRVSYLEKPVRLPGQKGVFKITLDPDVIPEGWNAVPTTKSSDSNLYATIGG